MILAKTLMLAVIALASVVIGRYWLDADTVIEHFRHSGYWTLTLTMVLFVVFCAKGYGAAAVALTRAPGWGADWKRRLGWCAAGVLPALLILYQAAVPGFKTVMDEHTIAATAKRMHEARKADVPVRVVSINGYPEVLWALVDKRPAFFQYLTSLVHDTTGFRPKNSVYLNLALTAGFVVLLFLVVERLTSPPGGALAVLLAATMPLLGLAANGGGLEILNLVLILALVPLGAGYLAHPSVHRLGALCMCAILLAQTRYESVLFIVPVALLVLWRHWRDRDFDWQWPLYLCPPLLIPYLWQNRVFASLDANWQLAEVAGATTPFGVHYIAPNLERAAEFFFRLSFQAGNSFLLSLFGGVCLLVLLVFGLRRVNRWPELSPLYQSAVFVGFGLAMLFCLLLAYAWEFNNPLVQRLTLPLHLPLMMAPSILLFHLMGAHPWPGRAGLAATVLFLAAFTIPANARGYLVKTYAAGHDYRLADAFLREREPGQRPLVVSDNPSFFYLMGVDCLSTALANVRGDQIDYFVNQPGTAPVYYFVPMVWDPVGGCFEYASRRRLDEAFILEPAWDRSYSEIGKVQAFRILGYEGAGWEEKAFESRRDYLIEFSRNLP